MYWSPKQKLAYDKASVKTKTAEYFKNGVNCFLFFFVLKINLFLFLEIEEALVFTDDFSSGKLKIIKPKEESSKFVFSNGSNSIFLSRV